MWSNFIFTLLLATPTLGGALQQHAPRVDDTEWRNVKCDHGALGSAQSDPFVMWNDAKATEGWSDCYEEYINNRSSIGFSNFVADYFHARPNINCGALDNANCEVTVNCGQSTSESAPINSPAGYMIVNSIIALHQHYESQYKGLLNALNFMNGEIGSYTSVFAPQLSQMKENKIMIDILMMGFGVVSAGTFNSWMKNLRYFTGSEKGKNRLGELKDITNTFMTQGINTIKDSMSAIDELKVQNTMADYLSKTVQSWVSATNMTLHYVIEESPLSLLNTIVNGQMWDLGEKPDALDITNDVRKALYTYVTPMAWKLAYGEVGAFIATNEGLDGTEGDCESWDPAEKWSKVYNIETKFFKANRFCGDKGEVAWLLNMKRSTKDSGDCSVSGAPGVSYCAGPNFEQLPGFDTLDGSQWGGLRAAELVTTAVRAWKKNGKKNGWESADMSTPQGQAEIIENGLKAIGMVNIPVCSFEEAFGNAWPDKKTDNWPCN